MSNGQDDVPIAGHARARIPNDVRVREGDYFVGSRAPQTQGRKKREHVQATKKK